MSILTFDIEEWFHLLDNESTKSEEDWIKYPVRIHENTDRILENLCNKNVKASFFVMGRIAEKVHEVVRKNVDYGFEIGSHTHMHQLAYEQNRFELRNDVERSIKVLEDISGEKVRLFRAPGFLITKKNYGLLMNWLV